LGVGYENDSEDPTDEEEMHDPVQTLACVPWETFSTRSIVHQN